MIKQPHEIKNLDKKFRMIIAGFPGIGKTSLALSAPRPLLVDTDMGIDRVEAKYRVPFIQPQNYQEILEDLNPKNAAALKDYDTLVLDTGGQLLKFMGAYVIENDSKNSKRDGSLSLAGYGAVAREFERFVNMCFYELKKHVIIVFHAKEEKDNDNTKLRLLVEGSTKDNVWQPMDLGGFIEIVNNKRVLEFGNTDKHFGKATHGIKTSYVVPELDDKTPNRFLTNLFAEIDETIKAEAEESEKVKTEYEKVMGQIQDIVSTVEDAETATKAVEMMKGVKHCLTSESEGRAMFAKATTKLGLKFDKEKGEYVAQSAEQPNEQEG